MRRAVIVGNAPWSWTPALVRLARRADWLLAADGGANHLARVGLRPVACVGDLDSVSDTVRAWIGPERLVLRDDQDRTDLDKTLAWAVEELGAGAVSVLAATGGRLDHTLENLALIGRWSARAEVELWDGSARIVPVSGKARLHTHAGQIVSLLPLGRCDGVTARGLRWLLTGDILDLASRTSVSNVAEGQEITLEVASGVVLVVLAGVEPD